LTFQYIYVTIRTNKEGATGNGPTFLSLATGVAAQACQNRGGYSCSFFVSFHDLLHPPASDADPGGFFVALAMFACAGTGYLAEVTH